jgi:hypothetical protein
MKRKHFDAIVVGAGSTTVSLAMYPWLGKGKRFKLKLCLENYGVQTAEEDTPITRNSRCSGVS